MAVPVVRVVGAGSLRKTWCLPVFKGVMGEEALPLQGSRCRTPLEPKGPTPISQMRGQVASRTHTGWAERHLV